MTKPILCSYDTDKRHPGVQRLLKSIDKWGWQYVLLEDPQWLGFGKKYKSVVNTMKQLRDSCDFTHAISIDARDFLVTGPPSEFVTPKVPLLISCEKGCWPDANRAKDYPKVDTPWCYANSPFTVDLSRLDLLPLNIQDYEDDQRHITNIYFNNKREDVDLDYSCDIIQSVAFCLPEWWTSFEIKEGRIYNKLTSSKPLMLHANGGTETKWWSQLE